MRSVDIERIENEARHPRLLDLHFALQGLRSTVSFMNSGAHPDDETSAMLAALGFRDGLDISYACANRGEGGQNDIGTESGVALGTLRTAEMERAASVLNMRLYWLSAHINDSISDFRFSKSGIETLAKWGHEHTLNRFVSIVRREKPDILCPTFLDIPGQHGHHRAMTQLAHEVVHAAADASLVVKHNGQALTPWTIAKLYLPAWGGGGTAYDDELPPPPATIVVNADGVDDLTGWSWERLGQQSRRYHATQGMGRWIASGTERNWPLHLAHSIFDESEQRITDNLPADLSHLAAYAHAPEIDSDLNCAQQAIDEAIDTFPRYPQVLASASSALDYIRKAQDNCPAHALHQVQHRLTRKITQLSSVIRIASGVEVHVVAQNAFLRPGQKTEVTKEIRQPAKQTESTAQCRVALALDENWSESDDNLLLSENPASSDPYPTEFFPDQPASPAVQVDLRFAGTESQSFLPIINTPVALPKRVLNLNSNSVVINTQTNKRDFTIDIDQCIPANAKISATAPGDWQVEANNKQITVQLPDNVTPGNYKLRLQLDGQSAQSERRIQYNHTSSRVLTNDTKIYVLVVDVELPEKRIAYVGGGNDRVAEHLRPVGLHITVLDDEALIAGRDLEKYDTLVVGLFAMRTRPALAQNISSIHEWVEKGGHLLTLYHRPWDNWQPDSIPPRHLEIGQPSLRFRVTNESAIVTHLLPDHVLLNSPNRIMEEDWQHWQKERGLYFAKTWDDSYQALLSMHDPDEEPLTGSLLSASIGKGRHTHTSLILHHQMANLVPGSFRLMANLLN